MYITMRLKTLKRFKATLILLLGGLQSRKACKSSIKENKSMSRMAPSQGFLLLTPLLAQATQIYCAQFICQMRKLAKSEVNQIGLKPQSNHRELSLNVWSCSCVMKRQHSKKIKEPNISWTSARLTILHNRSMSLRFSTSRLFETMLMRYQHMS